MPIRRRAAGSRAVAVALAWGLVACSGEPSPAPKAAPAPELTGLSRYLPLEHDTVYSYETFSEGSGEKGLLVLRVRRPRSDLAELDVAGRVQRLNLSEQGLELATGGFLLRAPLREGAEWHGDFGTVRVTSVNRTAEVPAGRFTGCLETVEELDSPEVSKRTKTLFCPDVGIVSRETEGQAGGQYALERIVLKSYGKAFTLDDAK